MGTAFARFMATLTGRALRFGVGVGLMSAGYSVGGAAGHGLMILGAVPAAAGLFNFCLIGPLIHAPLWGSETRG